MFSNDNTLLRMGDCLEVMREIPDGSVDMVLCDLPYSEQKNPRTKRGKFTTEGEFMQANYTLISVIVIDDAMTPPYLDATPFCLSQLRSPPRPSKPSSTCNVIVVSITGNAPV